MLLLGEIDDAHPAPGKLADNGEGADLLWRHCPGRRFLFPQNQGDPLQGLQVLGHVGQAARAGGTVLHVHPHLAPRLSRQRAGEQPLQFLEFGTGMVLTHSRLSNWDRSSRMRVRMRCLAL